MTGPGPDAVAVVGLAGRFPGAVDVDEPRRNLLSGTEAITRDGRGAFVVLDAPPASTPRSSATHPPRRPPSTPGTASCWSALGTHWRTPATTPARRRAGSASTRARAGPTTRRNRSYRDSGLAQHELGSDYVIRLGSAVDFATSRISHRLRLTGPAVTVRTACSTWLVAVHTAIQGLLAGDCDLAPAGGATVRIDLELSGQDVAGLIAPLGLCRPFDTKAEGTVPGNGAGWVVLRMLDDALAAGDPVHAVITGSAIGNDGGDKTLEGARDEWRHADSLVHRTHGRGPPAHAELLPSQRQLRR